MLQLTQGIVSLQQKVRRGIAKLPKAEARGAETKVLSSASWVVLDRSVWPCQVTTVEGSVGTAAHGASALFNGSSNSLPSSSAASSTTPSIFSQHNVSASSVLTMPTLSFLNVATLDDEAEKAGRCSESKVRRISKSDANSLVKVVADPWSCEDGQIVVQTAYGFSVVAPAIGRGSSRTTGVSLKVGMGMDQYDALAKVVAERSSRQDHEVMVFTSNVYDDLIYDQRSYETWVEWSGGRPAVDRVLWVLA